MLVRFCLFMCFFLMLGAADSMKWRGSSMRNEAQDLPTLVSLNANVVRVYAEWKHAQPAIAELDSSLSVASLRASASQWLPAYSASLDWSFLDARVQSAQDSDLGLIVETGDGTANALPGFNGTLMDPNVIGEQLYLAYQYRWVRTCVNRYKQSGVVLWQTENELNEALAESVGGVRLRQLDLLANVWGSWSFLTELLTTLRAAVLDEDPTARTTTNLHTEIDKQIHERFHLPGYYEDAARDWAALVDVMSIDVYPNYLIGTPVRGHAVGERVRTTAAAMANATTTATRPPVMVMECGFARAAVNGTNAMPTSINFTATNQAQFIREAYSSAEAAGSIGFLFFGAWYSHGIEAAYTGQDVSALQVADKAASTGNVGPLMRYSVAHPLYMASTFPGVVERVEHAWGALGAGGEHLAGYQALCDCFNDRNCSQ
jgi:hypothetical protein